MNPPMPLSACQFLIQACTGRILLENFEVKNFWHGKFLSLGLTLWTYGQISALGLQHSASGLPVSKLRGRLGQNIFKKELFLMAYHVVCSQNAQIHSQNIGNRPESDVIIKWLFFLIGSVPSS